MKIDGIPVVDAATPVEVHITPADKRLSDKLDPNRNDPDNCPAAVSAIRCGNATRAKMHIGRCFLLRGTGKKQRWYRYSTGAALRTEMISRDRGGTFAYGKYNILPVAKSARLGVKKSGPSGKHHKIKRGKPHFVVNIRRVAKY